MCFSHPPRDVNPSPYTVTRSPGSGALSTFHLVSVRLVCQSRQNHPHRKFSYSIVSYRSCVTRISKFGKILVTWCELIPVLYIATNGVIWTRIPPFIRLVMPQEALSIWRLVYQFPKVIRSGTDCINLVFNPQIDRTLYRGYTSNTLAMNLHNIVSLVSRSQCDTRAFLRIILSHKAHNM